ncbi:hypothetical protein A2153_03600 [Candidatus Gottesmanbacteria bacterium RBG_16_38_7b]|uniref:EamA domain-containing protein n=1 Tax=Candidatus Gottesmanbacteria bacterium RBG_16_38_7b TaxID=1798372 RepID=A0A1F5YHJ0_9BACT|nr:MAG: hypothetical protein A2153_03600 [Candidatus Gottesmanbacteria bacterium RBG_16_38_7b]
MLYIYFLSVLGGLFYAVTESINKNITEEKYSAFAYGFIQYFFNFILYLIPFLFFFNLPPMQIAYLYIALAVITVLIANTLLIKAYKTEDVSNISILYRISLVVSFFLGITLLQEPFSVFKLIGVFLIAVGIIVIFYEGQQLRLSSGSVIALFSGSLFGLLSYLDKIILNVFSPLAYITLTQLSMAAVSVSIPQVRLDFLRILNKYKKKIIISRLTAVFAIYLYLISIQKGSISVVNTNFQSVYLLSTVFIGIIFLKEKKYIVKKLTGSLFCTLGIILLNFF